VIKFNGRLIQIEAEEFGNFQAEVLLIDSMENLKLKAQTESSKASVQNPYEKEQRNFLSYPL
jgi:hypothetical protein